MRGSDTPAKENSRHWKLTNECEVDKCEPCLLCKPRRTNIHSTATRSGEVVVQVDGMPWKGGYKGQSGTITFSHRINKIVHVYPYCNKSEAAKILGDYLTHQLPKLLPRATCIQTDAGTEFTSREWVEQCRSAGLKARHAPPSCQAMNGQVEKDQATLAESARAMLKGRNVPDRYWTLALQTAAYLKNRTPHNALGGRLPVEVGTDETLEPHRLRTFGCAAFVQMEKGLRDGKGGDVRWKGMFVGYSPESPAWLILDPSSGRIREAYHVKFVEDEPGLSVGQGGGMPQGREVPVTQPAPQVTAEARQGEPAELEDEPEQAVDAGGEGRDTDLREGESSRGATTDPRRSTRAGTPRDLWDPSSPATDGTEKLRRERQAYSNQVLLAMATTVRSQAEEPRNWQEAIHEEKWLKSMKRERDALKSAGAYTLVPRNASMRVENGIWRFRTKMDQNGNIAKLKSRYVLDGSRQWSPTEREDIYSPVAELASIRSLLACAAEKGWEVIQADFTAAYLNAKLDEPVYLQQPPGLEEGGKRMVWKLSRAIYGMKQSGKLWYNELRGTLKELGYVPTKTDPCAFTRRNNDERDIIAVYIDDLLITGTGNRNRLDSLVLELGKFHDISK